jgi:hypothetical protein
MVSSIADKSSSNGPLDIICNSANLRRIPPQVPDFLISPTLLAWAEVICFGLRADAEAMTRAIRRMAAQAKRVGEIKKSGTWGGILLKLAELHMMSKGPFEELLSAIEDTISDL